MSHVGFAAALTYSCDCRENTAISSVLSSKDYGLFAMVGMGRER